ncbi:hypothetical protein IMSHALPRED_002301 [Imshaugia aleurites]|uniref:Aminoglycoside phosphotransferase domain-containing protein n=1 Tax=Imshaugia aleurites TaxID=172621 RepID=A0A8H3EZZ2_9LECA|nr:hypothetical protein IMSHALPRED_002301 [Imshaugia aleurites]
MPALISNSTSHTVANPDQQDDQIRRFGLSESQMHRFGGILRTMNLEAIPILASNVRQFGHHDTGIVSSETSCDSASTPCRIVDQPLCGSFNIVFTLEFDDGIKWMLKISANGHRFDSVAAAALISEARTMQLLKKETTIPVPTVYAFDASSHNRLNSPFILMERIDGQPLYKGWFDDDIPKAYLEHFRVKALQSLAEAMVQLNKFTLNRGGALEFDSAGRPVGLRGAKVVDAIAMCNRRVRVEDGSAATQDDTNHYDHDDIDESDEIQNTDNKNEVCDGYKKSEKDRNNENGDDNDEDIICEKGPFKCPKSAFLSDLDRCDTYCKDDEYLQGCYKALRMFIDLAFSNSDDRGRRFVLNHPDLDVQNVLVGEDGTLRGLIDWDGVASVPREIGCAQYPLWLMRDWVPYYYLYDIREGKTDDDAGYEESSPAELASYRAMYAQFMEKEMEHQTGGPNQPTTFGTLPKQEAQLTRRSLVMRDLGLAASSPFLTTDILCHILYQIEQVTEPKWEDLDLGGDSHSLCSSKMAVDSSSGTNDDDDSDSDEEEPEVEATDAPSDALRPTEAVASVDRADEGAAVSGRGLPQAMAKVTDCSLGVPQCDNGPQTSSKVCQTEAEELEMEQDINVASNSRPLCWGRRLVCFGCNTIEKGLRRIVKIGHVLEDSIDEVAEVLAEVELRNSYNTERPEERKPEQNMEFVGHEQLRKSRHLKVAKMERDEDICSNQSVVGPEQIQDIASHRALSELQETLSTRDRIEPDQNDEAALIQHKIELQDIPARKAELISGKTERSKAKHLTKKAATKDEMQVWDHIAFVVSSHGISLEQLRMNEHVIARCVVDTLQKKEKQAEDLVENHTTESAEQDGMHSTEKPDKTLLRDALKKAKGKVDVPLGASKAIIADITGSKRRKSRARKGPLEKTVFPTEMSVPILNDEPESSTAILSSSQPQAGLSVARNSRTLKRKGERKGKKKLVETEGERNSLGLGNKDPSSSRLPSHTTLSNGFVSARQPEMSSIGHELASESVSGQNILNPNDEALQATSEAVATLSSQPQSTSEELSRPDKTSSGLQALCSFGTSCLKRIFSSRKKFEDDDGIPTPESSVNGGSDGDSEGSESCKSSATSLSDDEMDLVSNSTTKEDNNEAFGMGVIPTSENSDGERNSMDVSEDLGKNQVKKKTSSRKDSSFAGSLGRVDRASKTYLTRRVHASCSGKSVGSNGSSNSVKANDKALYEDDYLDMELPHDRKNGLATRTGNEGEDGAENDGDGESCGDDEKNESTFRDDGEFRSRNIFNLLGMDKLDEPRLLRMQEGFLKLLEQY